MVRPSSKGNVVILLNERLSCFSDGQVTAGSKVSWGPTQLREAFSMLSEGRDSSSCGSDWSWFPCRSSRVKFFKLWVKKQKEKKCSPYFYLLVLFISADRMQTLPSRVQRETRADNYSSGPDGGYATAAAGQSHRWDRTGSPAHSQISPAGGSSLSLSAEQQSSRQTPALTRR